jgi:hypothetical protein
MSVALHALGEFVAASQWHHAKPEQQQTVDQSIRASLLCCLLGIERERSTWPYFFNKEGLSLGQQNTNRMLGEIFTPLDGIGCLATLAGAADLDPMDPGPSHTPLPATLAACFAAKMLNAHDPEKSIDQEQIGGGVLAGIEAAWRIRRTITGARPGLGFHSPGVFGTIAAAAAASRVLGLNALQCSQAMALALTRASGLASNSAASMVGMTHFGWGTFHGVESALLAANGWSASNDLFRALSTLFGEGKVDLERMQLEDGHFDAANNLVFKLYPCNIYTNLVVQMLTTVSATPVDKIHVTMPWIPHLDCPAPKDMRQARNSLQAVAAIAGAGGTSYSSFSSPDGAWQPSLAVSQLLPNVVLEMDKEAPTKLNEAKISVRAWRDGSLVLDAHGAMHDLKGWGRVHAESLLAGLEQQEGLEALYDQTYSKGYAYLKKRISFFQTK